jgi:hypothetical protein
MKKIFVVTDTYFRSKGVLFFNNKFNLLQRTGMCLKGFQILNNRPGQMPD